MRMLDFAPSSTETAFRDVQGVLSGLEQAKTALRGMGKYAPLDLVRELYAQNREPALGGEMRELSILFTDLEGFTSLSEHIPPDELARSLGLYMQTMTEAIRSCGGTIDKFIGDAVMALWNAPTLRPGHARLACRAILECRAATLPIARAYEAALASYMQRDFSGAVARLSQQEHDGPSRVLIRRCRALIARPPPPHWNGVHVAVAK